MYSIVGSSGEENTMDVTVWRILGFWILVISWVSGDSKARLQLEKEILQKMFLNSKFQMYNRPAKAGNQTADEPLDVFVSLYLLNIDVDEKNQDCIVQMYFRQEWNDSRLYYDNQGKINVLSVHEAVGFWSPDLFFVNEKSGHLHGLTKPNLFIRIYPEGRVLYSQRVTVKFSCPMDFRKYPFDTQICRLPIESYGYTASDLMLRWKTDTTFGDTEPPGFHVTHSTLEEIIYLSTNNYSRLELGIHLIRFSHSHLIHVYIPLGLLVAASWLSFCLRPTHQIPRLTAVIITTFATVSFVQSVGKFLYPLGYLTALDVWVGFACFLIFGAVFENIYVIAFLNQKPLTFQISNKKDMPEISDGDKPKRRLINILAGKLGSGDPSVDAIARVTFPSVFVLFNIVYLAYYLI